MDLPLPILNEYVAHAKGNTYIKDDSATTCAGAAAEVSDATEPPAAPGPDGDVGTSSLRKPGRNCSNRSLVSVHNRASSSSWVFSGGGIKMFEAFITRTRFFNDSGTASNWIAETCRPQLHQRKRPRVLQMLTSWSCPSPLFISRSIKSRIMSHISRNCAGLRVTGPISNCKNDLHNNADALSRVSDISLLPRRSSSSGLSTSSTMGKITL